MHASFRHVRRTTHGFTLLDMILTVLILALVLGIAIPGVSHTVSRVRAVSARTAITASLFDAHRNATVLGRQLVVCAGKDGCSGSADWSEGWIVFIDDNRDRQRGPAERIIRHEAALPRGVGLRSTVGRSRIVYQPNGSNAGSNVTFTLCDRRGPQAAERLILANGGRLRRDRAEAAPAVACVAGL
ncbi:MAG: GspH/FimT family pseudopilin [Lysobacter sp.]|nr:GspH/FimT family pseudopilin [Lysobacter sp.]